MNCQEYARNFSRRNLKTCVLHQTTIIKSEMVRETENVTRM